MYAFLSDGSIRAWTLCFRYTLHLLLYSLFLMNSTLCLFTWLKCCYLHSRPGSSISTSISTRDREYVPCRAERKRHSRDRTLRPRLCTLILASSSSMAVVTRLALQVF
ncbi:hypothetical protein BDZ89DRAFT_398840 [Hymenopellis radicata]|nr:hypothetical protein BDZ89DRAFT_398840 [Hymenopellis radicata]